MSPIHVAMINAMLRRRTCPRCARVTIAPVGKAQKPIRCRHCGAEIPPPKR